MHRSPPHDVMPMMASALVFSPPQREPPQARPTTGQELGAALLKAVEFEKAQGLVNVAVRPHQKRGDPPVSPQIHGKPQNSQVTLLSSV